MKPSLETRNSWLSRNKPKDIYYLFIYYLLFVPYRSLFLLVFSSVGRTSGSQETIYFIPIKTSSTSLTPLPIEFGIGRGWGGRELRRIKKVDLILATASLKVKPSLETWNSELS